MSFQEAKTRVYEEMVQWRREQGWDEEATGS